MLLEIFSSAVTLAKGSFLISVPVYLLAVAVAFVRKKIIESGIKNWLYSSFISTALILFVLFFIAYFYPALTAMQEQEIGKVPSIIAPSATETIASILFGAWKVVATTLLVSAILMPFELIGSYIHSKVVEKFPKLNDYARLYLTCFACSIIGTIVILFIIPELPTGVIYFLYFG